MRTLLIRGVVGAAILLSAAVAVAQIGFGGGGRRGAPVITGLPDVPGRFTFCRLRYETVRNDPSGSGWSIEYPPGRVQPDDEAVAVDPHANQPWRNGEPGHTVVNATDPELFQCPFVMMASPGTAGFTPIEVERLREYLLKGGFLWGDDFWGNASWAHWERELAKVLPEYAIVDIHFRIRSTRTSTGSMSYPRSHPSTVGDRGCRPPNWAPKAQRRTCAPSSMNTTESSY